MILNVELKLESGVEIRKVDSQGRFILPAKWRESELGSDREVLVIKGKGYMKIIPKRKLDLTKHFDRLDLGAEAIGNWEEFERKFYRETK